MAKGPLLSREAKLRANSLLDMLYTPSEMAEELGVEQRSIYSRLIPAGLPHRRDPQTGYIWLHGPEITRWARQLNRKRSKLSENEAYCLKCRRGVSLVDAKRITRGRFRMLQATCPNCGSKVNRGVKTS